MAGSIALVGFGLDSVVEVSSGVIILWQSRHPMPETRDRRALRLMAVSCFALAAYVSVESVRSLVSGHDPDPSPIGIGLATASLLITPFLLCTYLSAVLRRRVRRRLAARRTERPRPVSQWCD